VRLYHRENILQVVDSPDIIGVIEKAFQSYSDRTVQSGTVAHLAFTDPPGDFHIKSAHLAGAPVFVVKMASSFYKNPSRGVPSSNGIMMVFDAATGHPEGVLLDEGALTDMRTAIAGAVAARLIAPASPERLGVVGSGTQARVQAEWIARVLGIRDVQIWARDMEKAAALAKTLGQSGLSATPQASLESLCVDCDLVVTTTPSRTPLITKAMIRPGLRVVAIGSDTPGKQEVSDEVMAAADIILVDSFDQCSEYGDTASALARGIVERERIQEIGQALNNAFCLNLHPDAIAVADLTGIGALDAAIAEFAFHQLTAGTF
jgi:ornithine cyclodeaminase